ncbi:thionin-like protein 2 [Lactuca sativa]|uniref:thionin-like protein 2 n=1 Tax=Lactuca sativa TaxID=4236 RepID=UPI001C68D175|nr:thionin-like protein 2 [Lactuca sativa]
MEGKKMVKVMMMIFNIIMMVMGMVSGQDANGTTPTNPFPFTDCYGRCLFFCLIEPQNMCTCTSTCLKKCLDTPSNTMAMAVDGYGENFGYCKLGCATSLCSNISKPHNLVIRMEKAWEDVWILVPTSAP